MPGISAVDDVTEKVLLSINSSGTEIIQVVRWDDLRDGKVTGLS